METLDAGSRSDGLSDAETNGAEKPQCGNTVRKRGQTVMPTCTYPHRSTTLDAQSSSVQNAGRPIVNRLTVDDIAKFTRQIGSARQRLTDDRPIAKTQADVGTVAVVRVYLQRVDIPGKLVKQTATARSLLAVMISPQ